MVPAVVKLLPLICIPLIPTGLKFSVSTLYALISKLEFKIVIAAGLLAPTILNPFKSKLPPS